MGVHDHVRQRQGRAAHKFLSLRLVSTSFRSQMKRVLEREVCTVTKAHAGGRAGADVVDRRQAVGVIGGPFAGAVSPAELTPARHQADACRPIPRRVHIPFHVGVVSEEISLTIEGGVKGIAKAGTDQLPVLAVRIDLVDTAARSQDTGHEAVAVGHARQQVIFSPQLGNARCGQRLHHFRLVAAHNIKRLAVRTVEDGVRAVLAAGRNFAEQLRWLETVAAILGAEAI